MLPTIWIFADGSSQQKGDASAAGWGTLLRAKGHEPKELSGGKMGATNNQMEITAVIEGLGAVKNKEVPIVIVSDSAYVINCLTDKWYVGWRKNGWRTSQKKPVENRDLWERLLELVEDKRSVTFYHIDGHINLKKMEKVEGYWKKFNERNKVSFTLDQFIEIVEGNIRVDTLATTESQKLKAGV